MAAGATDLDAFVARLSAEDLAQLSYGDVEMNSPLGAPGNAGAFGGLTEGLRALGVPPVITTDGPSGIRVSAFASLLPCGTALASTWDPTLVEELEGLHAEEMLRKGSDVLLAPGMNIHRDPLCGRNFEYYSEDPLLTGLTAAAYVRGVQSRGVSACPKHLACNNQETMRWVNDSRVSQRALREIYLRGFRICVEQSRPRTIMTSYNKINGQWAHYNYDLVTTILRGEWGYEGLVITTGGCATPPTRSSRRWPTPPRACAPRSMSSCPAGARTRAPAPRAMMTPSWHATTPRTPPAST